MELVHRWSAERGDLAQMITGIPYFYRQFGYEYATKPTGDLLIAPSTRLDVPEGWTVRRAEHADVDDVVAIQEAAQSRFELVVARSADQWHTSLDAAGELYISLVAVGPHGRVAGTGMALPSRGNAPDARPFLVRLAASEPAAALALAAHAREDGRDLEVAGRPGTLAHVVLAAVARWRPTGWEPYFRIPDPVAFLRAVRPVLDARLSASAFAHATGTLFVSFYRSSLVIEYADGRVTAIEPGGPEQSPLDRGGVGVPPDLVATLLLGGCGAQTMAERFGDVALGVHESLMEVLFPEVEADHLFFL